MKVVASTRTTSSAASTKQLLHVALINCELHALRKALSLCPFSEVFVHLHRYFGMQASRILHAFSIDSSQSTRHMARGVPINMYRCIMHCQPIYLAATYVSVLRTATAIWCD